MVEEDLFAQRRELYGETGELCASCGMPLGTANDAGSDGSRTAAYTDDLGSLCSECERSIRSGELELERVDDDEPLV